MEVEFCQEIAAAIKGHLLAADFAVEESVSYGAYVSIPIKFHDGLDVNYGSITIDGRLQTIGARRRQSNGRWKMIEVEFNDPSGIEKILEVLEGR
jgi:hypothetical protein